MMKKILFWTVVPGVVVFLGFAGYTFFSIYESVKKITNIAKTDFRSP